jgi:serine/threonine-protein kinase
MKKHSSAITLGLLVVAFVCLLAVTSPDLPTRVASHFDGGGQPNGWMSRSSYLIFTAAFGVGLPAIVILGFRVLRHLPSDLINIPRRDYWLAPERRLATVTGLFHRSLWLACLLVAMMLGVHLLVVHANSQVPVRLSAPMILGLIGFFLSGVAAWILSLFRYFKRAA